MNLVFACLLSLVSILIAPGAHADHISKKKPYKISPSESLYLQNLLLQCEQGNGQTCDRYGRLLAQMNRPGDRRQALTYIRRACQLAYTPACVKKSPRERARYIGDVDHCGPNTDKLVHFAKVELAGQGARQKVVQLKRGSALAHAGLKSGDSILTVNGAVLVQPRAIYAALDSGRVMLQVQRKGSKIPFAVYCP